MTSDDTYLVRLVGDASNLEAAFERGEVSAEQFADSMDEVGRSLFDKVAPAVQKVAREIGEMSPHLNVMATEAQRGAARTEAALNNLYDRLASGGALTQRAIGPIITQHELWRKAIIQTHGSLDAAAPDMIADYRRVERELVQLARTADDVNDRIRAQRGEFGQMGSAAAKLGATYLDVTAKIGMATFAFREAWNVAQMAIGTGAEEQYLKELGEGWVDVKRKAYDYYLFVFGGGRDALLDVGGTDFAIDGKFRRGKTPEVFGPTREDLSRLQSEQAERLQLEASARQQREQVLGKEIELRKLLGQSIENQQRALDDLTAANLRAQKWSEGNIQQYLASTRAIRERTTAIEEQKRALAFEKQNDAFIGQLRGFLTPDGILGSDAAARKEMAPWLAMRAAQDKGWIDQSRAILGSVSTKEDEERFRKAGREFADAAAARLHDAFVNDLSRDLTALFVGGVHGLTDSLDGQFQDLVGRGAKRFAEELFGRRGDGRKDPTTGAYLPGSDPNQVFGGVLREKFGDKAEAALGGLSIGFAGYQAGLSGASGSRTGATLGGAMAGGELGFKLGAAAGGVTAPVGAVIGAIAGALIGAIGGALGAQERQSQYKYAVPHISGSGWASLYGVNSNIQSPEAALMTSRVQATYNQLHDEIVRSLVKNDAALPTWSAIDGRFQPRASQNYMKHFEEWLSGTLPNQIFGQAQPAFGAALGARGMGAERSAELFRLLSNVDPSKRVTLFDQLLTGLGDVQKAGQFWHADGPMGSGMYAAEMARLGRGTGITDSISEFDAEIVKLATHLRDLSPEGQIAAIAEIGQMEQQRLQMVKAAIQEVYDTIERGQMKYQASFENIDVQRFTREDGTVDQYALAQYYKDRAQGARFALDNATNAADKERYNDEFIRFINAAMAAGIAGDPKGRTGWLDWGQSQLGAGQAFFIKEMNELGAELDKITESFTSKLDPAMNDFLTNVTKVKDALGPGNGILDPIDNLIPRVKDLNAEFGATIIDLQAFRSALGVASPGKGFSASSDATLAPIVPFPTPIASDAAVQLLSNIQGLLERLIEVTTAGGAEAQSRQIEILKAQMDRYVRDRNFVASTIAGRM